MRADARAGQDRVSRGIALSTTITTRLTEALGCRHPIVPAGMGGPARSELAAAVSEAGGVGLLDMVRESPGLIAAGCLVLYRVGTLEDAVLAQSAGADVVIVQGGGDEGRPVYRSGTDSPWRSTTGDVEQMCLYAGESSAHVTGIHPAAAIIDAMMREATTALRGADAQQVAR